MNIYYDNDKKMIFFWLGYGIRFVVKVYILILKLMRFL